MTSLYRLLTFALFLAGINTLLHSQTIIPCKEVIARQATLGEGSIWHPQENILYWIDIDNGMLYTYNPVTQKENSYTLGQKVGTVVPIDTGGVLVALKDGVYAYNMQTKALKLLASPEKDLPDNRFNDGKCDPAGRFWVGSLGPNKSASLYKIESTGACTKMLDSVSTSNGIVWTADRKTMYYIDTNTGGVRAFEYDDKTGTISNPRFVIRFGKGIGYPDGMSIDSEGKLWIAHWGGSCVGRWDPSSGKLLSKIEVPAPNVTSCAFGGKNLDVLYITTARTGLSDDQLRKFPGSGNVFMALPGVKGVKAPVFRTRKN